MTQRRPYRPAPVRSSGADLSPTAALPNLQRRVAPTSTRTPFVPAPLHTTGAKAELEAQLTAAQAKIRALQGASAKHSSELLEIEHRYHASIAALQTAREQALTVLARDAAELGLLIARGLVRRAFEVDSAAMLGVVEETLAAAATDDRVVVKVAPDDADPIREHFTSQSIESITIEADPQLSRGDCVLESPQLVIDARVLTRLEALQEQLAACVPRDEPLDIDEPELPSDTSDASDASDASDDAPHASDDASDDSGDEC